MKFKDIKITQRLSTEEKPEAWEVCWTVTDSNMKNHRWMEMFDSFDEAVEFVKNNCK